MGDEPWNLRKFDKEFCNHAHGDLGAADRLIDWLVGLDPAFQEPLELLVERLKEILSKPPAAS